MSTKDVAVARERAEKLAEKVRVPGEVGGVLKRRYRAAVMDWYTCMAENPYYIDGQKEARMVAGIDMLRSVIQDCGYRAPKPLVRTHLHKLLYVPNNPDILYATGAINIQERWQYDHRRTARLYRNVHDWDVWRISISDLDASGTLGHGGELLYGHDTRNESLAVNIGVAWVLRGERP